LIKKIKNFKKYLILDSICAIDAIKKLNKSDKRFLLVIDSQSKVIGSITDGDIRRWLISGGNNSDDAKIIMNTNPVIGNIGEEEENLKKLNKVPLSYFKFLPVVDLNGILFELLINDSSVISYGSSALIMAGGFGKRLGKVTKNIPKPMVKIGDKSILDMTIKKLESSGFNKIFISVHHMAEKIEAFVDKRKNIAEISILREIEPLGTIGALKLIPNDIDWPLLIVNSDLIVDVKFQSIIDFHNNNNNDITVVTSNFTNEIPFGIVKSDNIGLIKNIEEKPIYSYPILAGIYCMNFKVKNFLKKKSYIDATDLINTAIDKGYRVQMFPMYEYWRDIGRPKDLEDAKKDMNINTNLYKNYRK